LVGALDMIHETLNGGNVQDLIYTINTALAENERALAELPTDNADTLYRLHFLRLVCKRSLVGLDRIECLRMIDCLERSASSTIAAQPGREVK
jgi:hypothetical protein